jgi:hypothetical protein
MTTPTQAADLAALLQNPYARDAAERAGYVQGVTLDGDDIDDLLANMASHGFHATADIARQAGVEGWNLRCNRCGTYGATWTDSSVRDERPGWGALALCPPHKRELADEHRSHAYRLAKLRQVNFHQDNR